MLTKLTYTRANKVRGTVMQCIAYCAPNVQPDALISRWNALGWQTYEYTLLSTEKVNDTKEFIHQSVN